MNKVAFFSNTILGAILLFSYYYFININPKIVNKLWGSIKGLERNLTIISGIVTSLLYLVLIYYLSFSFKKSNYNNKLINEIVTYQILLIIISMFWLPLSIEYIKNKNILLKFSIILTLFLVAIFAFIIFYKLLNIEDNKLIKKLALFAAFMLFFHTFFLDFINWNIKFFN
jgi:hypothetical protein